MTVALITTINNFTGLSTDVKPIGVAPGSTFWAYDTDMTYVSYDGANWAAKGRNDSLKSTTIDLHQAANTYDLFTGTDQDVLIQGLVIALPAVNVADDATITSISIQTNAATPSVIISSTSGAKANLTASAQISWTGAILLAATKKIQLTINGGASDAATVCKVTAEYVPITAGGYLT
jgi:hypothetical protein